MEIQFTDQNFAEYTAQGKPILIDFYAEWCGPCRQLKQELKDFDLVPIIEVDADEDEAFCEKYNIKNIPVLLLCDNEDKVLYRQVGFILKKDLIEKITKINENI